MDSITHIALGACMGEAFLDRKLGKKAMLWGALAQSIPDITSIERLTKARKNKLYVDFLQNRPKATLAAPYSLRPKPGATVSMPLYWEEVKKGLTMKDFTIENAMERIKSEGDIFKPVLGKGIDLNKILEKL